MFVILQYERDRLYVVRPAQAGVRLAVGDVRAEAAVLDHDRLAESAGRCRARCSGGAGARRGGGALGCARIASASRR